MTGRASLVRLLRIKSFQHRLVQIICARGKGGGVGRLLGRSDMGLQSFGVLLQPRGSSGRSIVEPLRACTRYDLEEGRPHLAAGGPRGGG